MYSLFAQRNKGKIMPNTTIKCPECGAQIGIAWADETEENREVIDKSYL
jgi:hypothetical protein